MVPHDVWRRNDICGAGRPGQAYWSARPDIMTGPGILAGPGMMARPGILAGPGKNITSNKSVKSGECKVWEVEEYVAKRLG